MLRLPPSAWLASNVLGYWTYYLAWIALSYALRYPWLALGVLVLFALRRVLPDPFILLRTAGRIGELRRQIESNPANVTARRDLASILIDRLRPRAALRLIEEARQRDPDNPELLYLEGVARLRSGDLEGALAPFVRAIEREPRIRFGEPYLLAGIALERLGRLEEAEDAFERYLDANSSGFEGQVRLALLRRRRGQREASRRTLNEALQTWQALPRAHRRRALSWWLRAQLVRVTL